MGLVVNTNVHALTAWRHLSQHMDGVGKQLERVSSGLRINRAADDPAGMAVSQNLDAERLSLRQALRNTNDGISLVQAFEGTQSELGNLMKRIRELAVQAGSETLSSDERSLVQVEFSQLAEEMDRLGEAYDDSTLYGSPSTDGWRVMVGIQSTSSHITVAATTMQYVSADDYGLGVNDISLSTTTAALSALTAIDTALNSNNSARASLGAYQNRFESAIRSLEEYTENVDVALSRVQDADFAWETAQLAKFQLLQQASVAMLAQANQIPEVATRLIA